jgi:hypothetical protein
MLDKTISKGFGTQKTSKSEERLNKKLLMTSKNIPNGKRFITAKTSTSRHKSSSIEALDLTSKIPLRRGSITSNSNSIGLLAKSTVMKPTSNIIKNMASKSINHSQTQSQLEKTDETLDAKSIKVSRFSS